LIDETPDYDHTVDVSAKPQRKSKTKRNLPSLDLVKDLNLHPEGKPHFAEFVAQKQPQKQQDQICVYLYYLRKILEIEGVTANHIFTCFKAANVRPPELLPQRICTVASRKGWFDTSNLKAIEITTSGVNHVDHALGNGKSEG
jgi:hypothetical protein